MSPTNTQSLAGGDVLEPGYKAVYQNLLAMASADDVHKTHSLGRGPWVWLSVVLYHMDVFFSSFPTPEDSIHPWSKMVESIQWIQATCTLMARLVSEIYEEPKPNAQGLEREPPQEELEAARLATMDIVRKIFNRLFAITFVLDLWVDKEVVLEGDAPSPIETRGKTFEAMKGMLQGLARSRWQVQDPESDASPSSQKILRTLADEIIQLTQRLVSSISVIPFPVTVTLFSPERIRALHEPLSQRESSDYRIIIADHSHAIVFLSTGLRAMLELGSTPGPFFAKQHRQLLECAKMLFDYCLSPSCSSASSRRIRALANTFEGILDAHPEHQPLALYMQERLLLARLQGALEQDVAPIDALLIRALQLGCIPTSKAIILQALAHQDPRTNPDVQTSLQSLAHAYLQFCPQDTEPRQDRVKQRLCDVSASRKATQSKEPPQPSAPPSTAGRRNLKDHIWRRQVKELVEKIITPDCVTWMDDDFRPNEPHTIRRVLVDVSDRFSRPLLHADEQSRLDLAQALKKLPCLLALCAGEDCTARTPGGPDLVSMYVPVVDALLDGPEDEVTPLVRQSVYTALPTILKHRNEEPLHPRMVARILQGLEDTDRGVRLRAGAVIPSVTQCFDGRTTFSRTTLLEWFGTLFKWIDNQRLSFRETFLLSAASMGKTTNEHVLKHTLAIFVTQLGHEDIIIRSLTCTQILKLAKYHKKTPYSLIHPHMDLIVEVVFRRLSRHPTVLNEITRVMAISPASFISSNLQRIVPDLLARCDAKGLGLVAKHLDTSLAMLIIADDHLALNLAPIFLLNDPAATKQSLDFILAILNESSNGKIVLPQLLPGCTTALLTELVVKMGEGPVAVETVSAAIVKVERALKPGAKANPSAFLSTQMLGIISRITDMLQGGHGRKSLDEKQKIVRSLGALCDFIGPPIHTVSSQIMATFQTTLSVPALSEATLGSWHEFLIVLNPDELGPILGPTCAVFLSLWPRLGDASQQIILQALQSTFRRLGNSVVHYLDDIPDLSIVDDLKPLQAHLSQLRVAPTPREHLNGLLNRCLNSNLTVATLSLEELKKMMQGDGQAYIQSLASGPAFDPTIGHMLATLFTAACRDGDGIEPLRLLAYECIGILGAVDPYRFEFPRKAEDMTVYRNYNDEGESTTFVLHLIENILVDTFRSTSDIKYQTYLAYPIQELLKYCGFSSDLVNGGRAIPMKIRSRWNNLKKDVLVVITPLLDGRYAFHPTPKSDIVLPIYPTQSTYREWLQLWVTHLISKVSGDNARRIFEVFLTVVKSKDVVIARHLLPHLVLNILISGDPNDGDDIRTEIRTVLEDQVDSHSASTQDKKLLSAQVIFALLDHLNRWARSMRRELSSKRKSESKRQRTSVFYEEAQEQLLRLDSILANLDLSLMANAAFQCKAYARSLMSFEQQIIALRRQDKNRNLEAYYDTIHEIYAHLDEPDGMEGVSTMINNPSIEHQIREHETTGRWTAAQSCWEVRLQQSPDNLEFHQGLLRCLRNLGHYDTLRNHVKGVLTHHPEWEADLADFHVESSWMVGAWDDVDALIQKVDTKSPSIMIANVLSAMRKGESEGISAALAAARNTLGSPINAAGVNGYVRSYDAVLNLHHLHELELIHNTTKSLPASLSKRKKALTGLSEVLTSRFNSALPTFRNLEPILSMRRVGFSLLRGSRPELMGEIASSWLTSAKIARKAGHWQTAYSAMLQGRQSGSQLYFIESVKLMKVDGEPLKALQDLEMHMKSIGYMSDSNTFDLTVEDEDSKLKAKLCLLRARWMDESERFGASMMIEDFRHATEADKNWESSHFYFGQYYDKSFKDLSEKERLRRGLKMNMYTVRNYSKAIRHGNKYIYHTVPRLLTLWLNAGMEPANMGNETFNKMHDIASSSFREIPAFKWYTAFPQIVSRVSHPVDKIYAVLSQLILSILQEYPKQALWPFLSVVKSTQAERSDRGKQILDKLRNTPSSMGRQLSRLIADSMMMTNELLALCDREIGDRQKPLSMAKDFPKLRMMGKCDLMIPLQESLTANLPSSSSSTSTHQPFPIDAPTFKEFADEVEIMKSMARPRKIVIIGSDGEEYTFLGKPKDDLRKDARLMDFNSIINKLLKTNSDARRRQLHIRTYGVIVLNEECGFIQWVPNTTAIRPVLLKAYDARKIKTWGPDMNALTDRMAKQDDAVAGKTFTEVMLPAIPPVFHEWFIETFPEPTAWLESRMNFGRTAAVMSMVGYILGLGDRHCENLLLDVMNGDAVHVDFNCLFEKGKTLATPERVPFRLTQNMVDGLGITGVEGVFRISCELSMALLRENKDCLMSVLDSFIYDPIGEWEDEKRRQESRLEKEGRAGRHGNPGGKVQQPKTPITTVAIANEVLSVIRKKLEGVLVTFKPKVDQSDKRLSTKNLVEGLIEEATSAQNLAKMYPGWAPWN